MEILYEIEKVLYMEKMEGTQALHVKDIYYVISCLYSRALYYILICFCIL